VTNPFSLFDFSARRRITAMRPRLYRLAYAWCHDPHLADDLAQETLAKALTHLGQLREAQVLEGWLFSILNNCWRDHLRGGREFEDIAELEEVIFSSEPGPEQLLSRRQTRDRVRGAIACLPLGQRQVLTLVDIEECSYAQVAGILEIPVGTVMSRLSRARQALRAHLENEERNVVPMHLRRVK
jgi:RNA polymerase sigma-70 factor, ECF subfamily